MRYRSGIGYDVHPLVNNKPLILGGVKIDYHKGLSGHSDADVLSHSIADAILGAIGEKDIGYWFPPSDEKLKNMNSLLILKKVSLLISKKKAFIENIDATIITELPKILPYIEKIKTSLAEALRIEESQIGIKATTNELMGFIGRGEGIAVLSVSSVAFNE